jgi:hypothetical protein
MMTACGRRWSEVADGVQLKIVAIITEDFSLYYDLVKELKKGSVSFVSLSFKDKIPANVGIVLTTEAEAPRIDFPDKISIPPEADLHAIINEAKRRMRGQEIYGKLVIGIDPGVRPGIAVIGGGNVIYTTQVGRPEDVEPVAREVISIYPAKEVVIRVGHGDPTNRNRVINSLGDLNVRIEIVDERSTTERTEFPDIKAAIHIALSSGQSVTPPLDIRPTNGELKNLQRQSRKLSRGQVTISTHLAEKVAKGLLSQEEAIRLQQGKPLDKKEDTSDDEDDEV